MILKGKDVYRWRRWFALFPVWVAGPSYERSYAWLQFYEWRYDKARGYDAFHRRAIGSTESIQTNIVPGGD